MASASAGYVFHTQLTHSLQVAQVGRRLAEKLHKRQGDLALALGGLNPDLVETACLAHDLGHPPFGHLAKEVLDKNARCFGGFEGNAQSFRIVTRLGIRALNHPGLNLTRGSLRGILKYPWVHSNQPKDSNHPTGRKPKWGTYDCDRETFHWVWSDPDDGPVPRAPEAEIMEWADDVTYSVHDVEDFFRAGLIPLHLLKSYGETRGKERERFFAYMAQSEPKDKSLAALSEKEIAKIFDDVLYCAAFSFEQPYEGTRQDHATLRNFTSRLIGRYINFLKLKEPEGSDDRPYSLKTCGHGFQIDGFQFPAPSLGVTSLDFEKLPVLPAVEGFFFGGLLVNNARCPSERHRLAAT